MAPKPVAGPAGADRRVVAGPRQELRSRALRSQALHSTVARRPLAGWPRIAAPLAALLGLAAADPALAQARDTARPAAAEAGTPTSFSIPRQPLAGAIDAFVRVTGWQVGFSSAAAGDFVSPAVEGTMTPGAALQRLLHGSGLVYRMTGPTTATIVSAFAQAPDGGGEAGVVLLDAITVQGEKVARDYFRTYTSIGVVTGQEIQELGIPDLKRSFELLANVRSAPANRGNNGFVIRGLNSEGVTQPTNSAPIISVVIDGAIQNGEATRRGARGVWDVEQIEVLRGPQSTLQGRNSLGGAVLVKTKDPTFTPEAIVEGQVGTDEWKSGAFAVSGAVVPNQVAVRIAGQTFREEKAITYTDPSVASLGRDEFDQIRGKVLVTPEWAPGLTGLFTVSHTRDKPAVTAVTGPDFFARRFDSTNSSVEFRETKVNNYVADLSYEVAPGWTVKSLTAYVDTAAAISTPNGASFQRAEVRDGGDFSQDLRLVFDPAGWAVSGVFGLFGGRFTNDTKSRIDTTAFGFPLLIQDLTLANRTESVAGYADLRFRFAERWTLIAGGRILRDKVSNSTDGVALDFDTFMNVALNQSGTTENTVFLPKGGLAYDLTPDQTLAATINRGYRAGFAEAVAGTGSVNTVAPEFLWSYELAWRSRWLDNRLQLNANVFWYDYTDQQIVVDNPLVRGTSITQNAGKSHVYGAEIEGRARVTDELTMFGSLGLLRTRFDEAVTFSGDFSGNQFPESPTVTAAIGGIWKHHTGFFVAGDVSYTHGYYSAGDPGNDPMRWVGSFTVANARVGWETKHATVSVFVRNLFDEQYLTSISAPSGGVYNEATIGDGRLVGIRLTGRL
ncbi:TonB-dependent receptor [Rhodoplanes sp. TEM]|uniref:TonB-dependent receptor n=1 Tax=Rhodoplanes tepidamans TaxID=200616 RepID=A0ABT5JEW6_RHOTP|nr:MULTISPECIES: TonB-dependent receptor [Rhodoplanes]MDC7788144.1 TonB-dependent receptor [Rhodoplanes tepidamans]MDC7987264.1 TonB-dependent receptor [Rhodoplanes sp. TEM]MDQ0355166.1 outer membrane receptor protein involved in Fe transport [Rhodoplanes tepidamans]